MYKKLPYGFAILCRLCFKKQKKLIRMEPRKMLLWLWMSKNFCHQKGESRMPKKISKEKSGKK